MEARRPVREADHTPPSNPTYSYTSISQDAFTAFTREILAPYSLSISHTLFVRMK